MSARSAVPGSCENAPWSRQTVLRCFDKTAANLETGLGNERLQVRVDTVVIVVRTLLLTLASVLAMLSPDIIG